MDILFVCLGNICRSPAAEGLFNHFITELGLEGLHRSDSAGTSSYHIGEPPDSRMTSVARERGIQFSGSARQITSADFNEYDFILVMDEQNFEEVLNLSPSPDASKKLMYFREFDPEANGDMAVPDPYFGGAKGFEEVLEMLTRTVKNLIDFLKNQK
jgi:low molecular weight protein-tyrosine phosphatase